MRKLMQTAATLFAPDFARFVLVLPLPWPTRRNHPPPNVPDTIKAPPGEEVVLRHTRNGSQIYTCQCRRGGKFALTLKAPEAELKDGRQGNRNAFCRPRPEAKRRERSEGKSDRLIVDSGR